MIAEKKEPAQAKAEAPGQTANNKSESPKQPAFNPTWEKPALGVQAELAVSAYGGSPRGHPPYELVTKVSGQGGF